MLLTMQQSSHWYTQNGEPAYDADLRRARKENLLPSVSTITHLMQNEALINWRIEQAIMSALTLPKLEGETPDQFARRVVEDMDAQSRVARERGEKVHLYAQLYIENAPQEELPVIDDELRPVLSQLLDWIDFTLAPGGTCEKTFAELEYGYGGRIDYVGATRDGQPIILDFKTQNVKAGKSKPRINFYDEWAYQLAAYAYAEKVPFDKCYSVVISTNPDVPIVEVYNWDKSEIEIAFDTFLALANTFRKIKKFEYVRVS